MAVLRTPHFDLPFRFQSTGTACVEQDSYADVANCVEAIIRTPFGFRYDTPDFGLPPLEFEEQPLGVDDLGLLVQGQESRSRTIWTEQPDAFDELIARVRVEIQAHPQGEE